MATALVMGVPLGWVTVMVVGCLVSWVVLRVATWLVMSLPWVGVVGMVRGGGMSKVQV